MMRAPVVKIHQTETIEGHHFTPLATLLFQLPRAINGVFGNESIFYYEYKPKRDSLELTVYYRRSHGQRADMEFVRTAYSFNEILDVLTEAKKNSDEYNDQSDSKWSSKSTDGLRPD